MAVKPVLLRRVVPGSGEYDSPVVELNDPVVIDHIIPSSLMHNTGLLQVRVSSAETSCKPAVSIRVLLR